MGGGAGTCSSPPYALFISELAVQDAKNSRADGAKVNGIFPSGERQSQPPINGAENVARPPHAPLRCAKVATLTHPLCLDAEPEERNFATKEKFPKCGKSSELTRGGNSATNAS